MTNPLLQSQQRENDKQLRQQSRSEQLKSNLLDQILKELKEIREILNRKEDIAAK